MYSQKPINLDLNNFEKPIKPNIEKVSMQGMFVIVILQKKQKCNWGNLFQEQEDLAGFQKNLLNLSWSRTKSFTENKTQTNF